MSNTSELKLSRKALYEEIWTDSASKTAKKYGIPYSQFLKLCRSNGIPIPAAGYWTKVSVGKPVERTPLPDRDNDEITVSLGPQETTEPMLSPPPVSAEAVREDGKIGLVLPEPPKGKYDRQTGLGGAHDQGVQTLRDERQRPSQGVPFHVYPFP